jgi:hypothetical protein
MCLHCPYAERNQQNELERGYKELLSQKKRVTLREKARVRRARAQADAPPGTLNRSETRHFYIAENPTFLLCCDMRKHRLFFL